MPSAALWAYLEEKYFYNRATADSLRAVLLLHFHRKGPKGKLHLLHLFSLEVTAQLENMLLATAAPSVKKQTSQARRLGWFAILKNNISLFYAQSEAEGILNDYSRLCRLQKCLLARYMLHQMTRARMRYTGFFMALTSDCPNNAIMATITPLPSSMVMR